MEEMNVTCPETRGQAVTWEQRKRAAEMLLYQLTDPTASPPHTRASE